ncbi:MAG: hypothetical protein PHE58_06370, partial [Candidatus Omnitrophica bacterium]|nr:hypothetical protein [Candidatus Omnitrophota bacterium]
MEEISPLAHQLDISLRRTNKHPSKHSDGGLEVAGILVVAFIFVLAYVSARWVFAVIFYYQIARIVVEEEAERWQTQQIPFSVGYDEMSGDLFDFISWDADRKDFFVKKIQAALGVKVRNIEFFDAVTGNTCVNGRIQKNTAPFISFETYVVSPEDRQAVDDILMELKNTAVSFDGGTFSDTEINIFAQILDFSRDQSANRKLSRAFKDNGVLTQVLELDWAKRNRNTIFRVLRNFKTNVHENRIPVLFAYIEFLSNYAVQEKMAAFDAPMQDTIVSMLKDISLYADSQSTRAIQELKAFILDAELEKALSLQGSWYEQREAVYSIAKEFTSGLRREKIHQALWALRFFLIDEEMSVLVGDESIWHDKKDAIIGILRNILLVNTNAFAEASVELIEVLKNNETQAAEKEQRIPEVLIERTINECLSDTVKDTLVWKINHPVNTLFETYRMRPFYRLGILFALYRFDLRSLVLERLLVKEKESGVYTISMLIHPVSVGLLLGDVPYSSVTPIWDFNSGSPRVDENHVDELPVVAHLRELGFPEEKAFLTGRNVRVECGNTGWNVKLAYANENLRDVNAEAWINASIIDTGDEQYSGIHPVPLIPSNAQSGVYLFKISVSYLETITPNVKHLNLYKTLDGAYYIGFAYQADRGYFDFNNTITINELLLLPKNLAYLQKIFGIPQKELIPMFHTINQEPYDLNYVPAGCMSLTSSYLDDHNMRKIGTIADLSSIHMGKFFGDSARAQLFQVFLFAAQRSARQKITYRDFSRLLQSGLDEYAGIILGSVPEYFSSLDMDLYSRKIVGGFEHLRSGVSLGEGGNSVLSIPELVELADFAAISMVNEIIQRKNHTVNSDGGEEALVKNILHGFLKERRLTPEQKQAKYLRSGKAIEYASGRKYSTRRYADFFSEKTNMRYWPESSMEKEQILADWLDAMVSLSGKKVVQYRAGPYPFFGIQAAKKGATVILSDPRPGTYVRDFIQGKPFVLADFRSAEAKMRQVSPCSDLSREYSKELLKVSPLELIQTLVRVSLNIQEDIWVKLSAKEKIHYILSWAGNNPKFNLDAAEYFGDKSHDFWALTDEERLPYILEYISDNYRDSLSYAAEMTGLQILREHAWDEATYNEIYAQYVYGAYHSFIYGYSPYSLREAQGLYFEDGFNREIRKFLFGDDQQEREFISSRIECACGKELSDAGIEPSTADVVFAGYDLSYAESPLETSRGIWEVLKTGGYFVAYVKPEGGEDNKKMPFTSAEVIIKYLTSIGFREQDVVVIEYRDEIPNSIPGYQHEFLFFARKADNVPAP